jgi:hypothetical protein
VSDPSGPERVGFEVIAQGTRRTADRHLAVAVDTSELSEMATANEAYLYGSVDFQQHVVVVFTAPLDTCSPELTGLELNDRVLTAVFEPSRYECPVTTATLPEPWYETVLFVALERTGLPPTFTLRLPPDPATGDEEELLDVHLPPIDDLPPSPAFEALAVQDVGTEAGPVWAAIDAVQLDDLWRSARLAGQPPSVDFEKHAVIAVSVYGSGSCVDRFAGFDVDADRVWTPLWTQPGGVCTADAVPRTYVIAVDRQAAEPEFTLRRLDGPIYIPRGERRLHVQVPPL